MESKSLQLLIATGLYPPDIGGPATYSRMLEEKLSEHNIVTTIVPFGKVRHMPKILRHIAYAWLLFKESKHCDAIYALDPISVGLPALLVSFITGKYFLIRLGGDYAWEQGQQRFGLHATLDEYTRDPKSAPLLVRVFAALQTFVVQRAEVVIAPSEYLKAIITSWGVESSNVEVIYSALFPLKVTKRKEELRTQLSYAGTVICSVGRLVPWKGFGELIEVVGVLRDQLPPITLIIIGDGPEQEVLQQKIETLQLQKNVRLFGKLGKDALGAAIKASDIFVLNTSYEGLSHQLLEVMDLGVPIVTTQIGGNPELIVDGVSGILVPVKNNEELKKALLRLMGNQTLQTQLVQHAKVRTLDFSQDAVVSQFASLLNKICSK